MENEYKSLINKHRKIIGSEHIKEWDNYESFKEWALKSGYKTSKELPRGYYHALFRRDNNEPYSPEQCYWKKMFHVKNWMKETYHTNVETMSLYDWCLKLNLDYSIVGNKIIKENVPYDVALGLARNQKVKALSF